MANGIAKQMRSPRENEGDGRQEGVAGSMGITETFGVAEQAEINGSRRENKPRRRSNIITASDNGGGTTDKYRVGSGTKTKLTIGSWNVCSAKG